MIASPGTVIIAIDLQDKYIQKVRGSFLQLDPTWAPEEFVKTDARVIAVPKHMRRGVDSITRIQKNTDPLFRKSMMNEVKTGGTVKIEDQSYLIKDIKPIVQVGDRVILHYVAIDYDEAFIHNGQYMLQILYLDIYAAVRDGEILPVGGWVFLEEEKMEEDIPVSQLTLPYKVEKKDADHKIGIVKHIGRNIGDRPPVAKVGDRVVLPKHCAWVEFEETKYLVVPQDEIAAVYDAEEI